MTCINIAYCIKNTLKAENVAGRKCRGQKMSRAENVAGRKCCGQKMLRAENVAGRKCCGQKMLRAENVVQITTFKFLILHDFFPATFKFQNSKF